MTRLRWTEAMTAAVVGMVLLPGCATVITGTRQDIQVESQPAGAVCTFTRAGETLGSVTTPGTLKVKRDAAPMTVVCTRADYEEQRTVMHSTMEPTTIGSAIIGGFIATHIDRGSGAANRYETSVRVNLTPMSAADKAAAARVAAPAAAVSAGTPQVGAARTVPADAHSPASSRFDGDYQADIELIQRTPRGDRLNPRHIEVTVRGGVGTGTVKHPACEQPGELRLTIDAAGEVSGTANTVNTDRCQNHTATLTGRVEGRDIRLTITRARHENAPTAVTLTRKPVSAAALDIAPGG
jgi:hypothetical protein